MSHAVNNDHYLVQRLQLRSDPEPARGFDGVFRLDYMGSSEYEWGAAGESLKAIRAKGPVAVHEITIFGVLVFLVTNGDVDAEVLSLAYWVARSQDGDRWASKERSYFPEFLTGNERDYHRVDAWWSFTAGNGWALDQGTADLLAQAFNAKPAKS